MTVGNARRTPPATRRPHGDSAEVDIDAEGIYGLHCDFSRSAPRPIFSVRPSLTLLLGFTARVASRAAKNLHARQVCPMRARRDTFCLPTATGTSEISPVSDHRLRRERRRWVAPNLRTFKPVTLAVSARAKKSVAHRGLTEPGSCDFRCQAHCSDERNLGLGDCR